MAEVFSTEYPTSNRFIDHSGEEINGIKVLRYAGRDKWNKILYECQCHCGTIFNTHWSELHRGITKSCGCFRGLHNRQDDKYLRCIGQSFGKFTVIDFSRTYENGKNLTTAYFICRCECGNTITARATDIICGRLPSCQCSKAEIYKKIKENYRPPEEILSHIGETHNYLTIIGVIRKESDNGRRSNFYKCTCICGNTTEIRCHRVLTNQTISCGCYHDGLLARMEIRERYRAHDLSSTTLYKKWIGIKQRCHNPNHIHYKHYGGRGVNICNEWLAFDYNTNVNIGFINFYNWSIEAGYHEGLTIDRIDVNGNYEPNNCRWITQDAQSKNKRSNVYITYEQKFDEIGKPPIRYTFPVSIWSKITGLSGHTITNRLRKSRNNWTVEQALLTKPHCNDFTPIILNVSEYMEYNRPDFYEDSIHD